MSNNPDSVHATFHGDAGDQEHMASITKEIGGADWLVTSPPYDDTPRILTCAKNHAKIGVAFKMSNALLEPCRKRDDNAWLQDNPPAKVIFLTRQTYSRPKRAGSHRLRIGEFWGIWYTKEQQKDRTGTQLSWARA
jgi:hypothetical protein